MASQSSINQASGNQENMPKKTQLIEISSDCEKSSQDEEDDESGNQRIVMSGDDEGSAKEFEYDLLQGINANLQEYDRGITRPVDSGGNKIIESASSKVDEEPIDGSACDDDGDKKLPARRDPNQAANAERVAPSVREEGEEEGGMVSSPHARSVPIALEPAAIIGEVLGSDLDEDLLTCLPITPGAELLMGSIEDQGAGPYSGTVFAKHDSSDDALSDDGDKKMPAKRGPRHVAQEDSSFSSEPEGLDKENPSNEEYPNAKKDSSEDSTQEGASASEDEIEEHTAQAEASDSQGEEEAVIERDYDPQVGDRVYAEFPLDGEWYWGNVSGYKRYESSRSYVYSVDFEDGDQAANLRRLKIRTVWEYIAEFHADPLPPHGQNVNTALTLRQIQAGRCKWCELCTKRDCGSCTSCQNNKRASLNHSQREVCLQKMCLHIPDPQKRQAAKGLPSGWTFVFARDTPYITKSGQPHVPGLFIHHSECNKKFRSIEAAVVFCPKLKDFNPNVVAEFNNHIGVIAEGKGKRDSEKKSEASASPSGADVPLSPQDMYAHRCDQCELCLKPDCRSCSSCRSNTKNPGRRRAVCLHKMCLEIPDPRKKQPAKGLPPGWTFIFSHNTPFHHKNTRDYTPGLFISYRDHPSQIFRSIEAAVARVKKLKELNPNVVEDFNTHIGAGAASSSSNSSSHTKSITDSDQTAEACYSTDTASIATSAPCGVCENCTKAACGECAMCSSSESGKSPDCFQKMCYELPVDAKAQTAVGFPKGWTFYFAENISGAPRYEPVPGLFILSKGGKKFRSVQAAAVYNVGDKVNEVARKFYTHVGLPHEIESDRSHVASRPRKKQRTDDSMAITDYSLVGRGVCFAWTDASGQTKIIYGEVIQCDEDENGEVPVDMFNVLYSPQSRNDSGCASTVPESQVLSLPSILGGCISLEQQTSATRQSSLMNHAKDKYEFLNWIVPNWRKEDQLVIANAQLLPRLTLFVRGYRLELYVKQSSIPNAGYGVFLKCTSLTNGHDGRPMGPLVLEAGELIDLGVYGPFGNQDVKKKAVFFVKNFIHSHKCEEWAFDFGDSQYEVDITDDVTGDIHSEARKHICAYVNESNVEDKVCIRAEHDPEGSVHYLLGHPHQSQGPLIVPLNGDGMEVFVHYQDDYEKVRVRKGYSFLPDGEKKDLLLKEIANEDVEDVKHVDEMNAADVKASVDFLLDLMLKESFYSSIIIDRTLIVAAVLQRRAKRLQDDDNSDANMNTVFERSSKLVSFLLTGISGDEDGELKRLQAERKVVQVLIRIFKLCFSEGEQSELYEMMF